MRSLGYFRACYALLDLSHEDASNDINKNILPQKLSILLLTMLLETCKHMSVFKKNASYLQIPMLEILFKTWIYVKRYAESNKLG